jgi:hypothetical protein
MRRLRDRHLPDPFRAWINRARPLPPGVTLLPRTIDVWGDVLALVCVGMPCLAMAGLIGSLSRSFLSDPDGVALFVLFFIVLLGVPLWMAYWLWRTLGARRDQQAGTLRQGVLVGPEGVLVRLAPNRCYPVPLERFVTAKEWSGGGDEGTDWLTIETTDGPVDFAARYLTVGAAAVNQAVAAVRPRPAASRGTSGPQTCK